MTKYIDIIGCIGAENYWYQVVSGTYIKDQIAGVTEKDTIVLRIYSPGGEVEEGNYIINLLRSTRATLECEIMGACASMATLIAAHCSKVRMCDNAEYMIHKAQGCECGTDEDLKAYAKRLANINAIAIAQYAKKTGKTVEYITDKYFNDSTDHWLSPQEALAEGFADEIIDFSTVQAEPQGNALSDRIAQLEQAIQELITKEASDDQGEQEGGEEMSAKKQGVKMKAFATMSYDKQKNLFEQKKMNPKDQKVAEDTELKIPATKTEVAAQPITQQGDTNALIADMNSTIERLTAQTKADQERIESLVSEKEALQAQHLKDIDAKNTDLNAAKAEKSTLENEVITLKKQNTTLAIENKVNVAVSLLRTKSGLPLNTSDVEKIKNSFLVQNRVEDEGEGYRITNRASNAILNPSLEHTVAHFASVQFPHLFQVQAGNSLSGNTDAQTTTNANTQKRYEEVIAECKAKGYATFSKEECKALVNAGLRDSVPAQYLKTFNL